MPVPVRVPSASAGAIRDTRAPALTALSTAPGTQHSAPHQAPSTQHAALSLSVFPTILRPSPSNDRVTDAELVERARRGDRAAFDAIVERYQHVVFRTALAVTSNREEAEDAAQETFLRAFAHIGTFRGDSSLKTWLLAIAWREGISKRRSLVNRLRRMVSTPEDEAFDPPAAGRTEEARVMDVEHALTVRRLVARLPQSYREALILAAAGDYTFDEMSAALGVPVGTLKWRVSEARRQLREKLRALGYQG